MPNESTDQNTSFTSLYRLFDKRFFRIPNYQRGYAWTDRQRSDLWDDLSSLREGMDHYAGTIVLRKLSPVSFPEDSFERAALSENTHVQAFDVVDGQQRLTTLVILINELIRFLGDNTVVPLNEAPDGQATTEALKKRFLFRGDENNGYFALDYAQDSEESRHLQTAIFNGGSGWDEDRLTSYMRNLQNAAVFFRGNIEFLSDRLGGDAVIQILVRAVERFKFHQITLTDDYNVGVAFETMNNRGLQLSNLELLKNRLLYLTELFDGRTLTPPMRSNLRRTIVNAWHNIYIQLGRDSRVVLNDNEFLKAHWTVYFTFTKRRGNDYADFLLHKQFVAERLFERGDAVVVSRPIDPHEENPDEEEDEDEEENRPERGAGGLRDLTPRMVSEYVQDLSDFSGWWQKVYCPDRPGSGLDTQVVEALTRLRHLGMGYIKPLLAAVLKAGADQPDQVANLFNTIERFRFKAFHLGSSRSNYGQTEFLGAARKLHLGDCTLQDLFAEELWSRLENRDFVGQFKIKMADLHRKGDGFYRWNGIRYFLFEYNADLARNFQRDPALAWDDFNRSAEGTVSIEHILPQTPTEWYWRNQFRAFSQEELTRLTGALGNLLPLSLPINIALQNDPFARKKEGRPARDGQGGHGGYRYGCLAEIEVAENQDWSAQTIYGRSRKLMGFLRRRWGVEISEDAEKEILGLEFVNDGREIPPELPNEPESRPVAPPANRGHVTAPVNGDDRNRFWNGLENWCRQHQLNILRTRTGNGYNTQGVIRLWIDRDSSLLYLDIYCNGMDWTQQKQQIEVHSNAIEEAFQGDEDIEVRNTRPGGDHLPAIAVYLQNADWRNPTDELYQRLIDARTRLQGVLRQLGVI